MKHVIIDIDGCAYDWFGGFVAWMQKLGYEVSGRNDTYEMSTWFTNVTPKLAQELIREFNCGEFQHLREMPGAYDAIREIRGLGLQPVVITSCGIRADTTMVRARQVASVCGRDTPLHILPLGASKLDLYLKYHQAIVIDDSEDNLKAAVTAGNAAVAFDQPFNQAWSGHRIKSWSEAPALVAQIVEATAYLKGAA
jgi:FMN phosphatase YigB (HAD superfamily)